MAGLSSTGLTTLSLPEIITEIENNERINIDPNITTRDDELLGQLNNIIGLALAEQWELAQAVYDGFNPLTAEGTQLDDIAAIIGVIRINATKSYTTSQTFFGDQGTSIDVGTQLTNKVTGDLFTVTLAGALDRAFCSKYSFQVSEVTDSVTYAITVQGTVLTFTSQVSATATTIMAQLKALLDTEVTGGAAYTVALANDIMTITATAGNITILGLTLFEDVYIYNETSVEATVTGVIVAGPGTIIDLVVSITGIAGTTNASAYILGSDVEKDEAFRGRIQVSQQGGGSATVAAIEDAIANLDGVTTTVVIENRTLSTVDSIPGKAFEVIVVGGNDDTIAAKIWNTKPIGIETYGTTAVIVVDSLGQNQTINFSRPVSVFIAIQIKYDLYSEETLPASGVAFVQTAVAAACNKLGIGIDVIPTRFYSAIYGATDGLSVTAINLQVLTSAGDTPVGGSWSAATIAISNSQFANTIVTDIYVEAN